MNHKRDMACIYWGLLLPMLPVIFDGNVPDDVTKWVTVVGLVLTYFGLGHAVVKNRGKVLKNME
jgi:hypothetical protein